MAGGLMSMAGQRDSGAATTGQEVGDLRRAFVMRRGERLPVDLDRLINKGDLSQNVLLEPGDFVFFSSMAIKEVYVLGEVRSPGPMTWTENATVVSAIANRAGFNDRAYKSKVVVIRGSLNHPQTFIVNTWGTFEGKQLDFKLEPKDIVYVHYRPFIYVEELLDLAITGFLQSMSAGTAGELDPLIRKPLF